MIPETLAAVCMSLGYGRTKARLMVAALQTSRTEARALDAQPLTELDAMLTEDERRTISVDQHLEFQRSLEAAIAEDDFDEMIGVPPRDFNPPARRKDSELARVLDLLNNLPRGKAKQHES